MGEIIKGQFRREPTMRSIGDSRAVTTHRDQIEARVLNRVGEYVVLLNLWADIQINDRGRSPDRILDSREERAMDFTNSTPFTQSMLHRDLLSSIDFYLVPSFEQTLSEWQELKNEDGLTNGHLRHEVMIRQEKFKRRDRRNQLEYLRGFKTEVEDELITRFPNYLGVFSSYSVKSGIPLADINTQVAEAGWAFSRGDRKTKLKVSRNIREKMKDLPAKRFEILIAQFRDFEREGIISADVSRIYISSEEFEEKFQAPSEDYSKEDVVVALEAYLARELHEQSIKVRKPRTKIS